MDSINLLGVFAPVDNTQQHKPKRGPNSAIPLPSRVYLRECFEYDAITGQLTWRERPRSHFNCDGSHKSWNGKWAGKTAGSVDKEHGYGQVKCSSIDYKAHRICYKIATGEEHLQLDHIDGNRANNALSNLRPATNAINSLNRAMSSRNTSGVTGIYWSKQHGMWRAILQVDGKAKHLGLFKEKAAAISARRDAEAKHGYDPYHGLSADVRAKRNVEEVTHD